MTPTTPITWLIFLTELRFPNAKLEGATKRRLNGLSLVEAIAALALLQLSEQGQRTVASAAITATAGRSIQLKTMLRLREKHLLEDIPPIGSRHQWRLKPEAIAALKQSHAALAALIAKATRNIAA